MKRILASLAVMALASAPALDPAATAQSWAPSDARNARQSGDIIPLRDIIRRLKQEYGGNYVDLQGLKSDGRGGSQYHIDWEKDGRKFVFVVDAKSGRVIRSSGG